jgi:hypothetical protein
MWRQLYTNDDQLKSLVAARNADGRLEVFGVNRFQRMWHTWQTTPNGVWTGRWHQLYTDNDHSVSLAVANNADGRLEVFGINRNQHIWHTWQIAPGGIWTGAWHQLYRNSDQLTSLAVANNADGRLEVFGINSRHHVWHTWQTTPNGGWIGHWRQLYVDADLFERHAVAANADGRLEVFCLDPAERIRHTWQKKPDNGWIGDVRPLDTTPREVDFKVRECNFEWRAAFRQAGTDITVRIRLKPDPGVDPQQLATAMETWRTGIRNEWNNRFRCSSGGEDHRTLTFDVQWNAPDPHHTVRVRAGRGRTFLDAWFVEADGRSAAHEFGHMLGHKDEYGDPNCRSRSPVGTHTIMDNDTGPPDLRLYEGFCRRVNRDTSPV